MAGHSIFFPYKSLVVLLVEGCHSTTKTFFLRNYYQNYICEELFTKALTTKELFFKKYFHECTSLRWPSLLQQVCTTSHRYHLKLSPWQINPYLTMYMCWLLREYSSWIRHAFKPQFPPEDTMGIITTSSFKILDSLWRACGGNLGPHVWSMRFRGKCYILRPYFLLYFNLRIKNHTLCASFQNDDHISHVYYAFSM